MHRRLPRPAAITLVTAAALVAPPAGAQRAATAGRDPAPAVSAPVRDVRYEIAFDRRTGTSRTMRVAMSFATQGSDPVLLSLPAWTPGAYEISNFARKVRDFTATGDGRPLVWDKYDYDTWRLRPAGARAVTVSFTYEADSLDNAMAWSQRDFLMFNGTNVFLYPEGRGFDWAADVRVVTEPTWLVATGMAQKGERTYTASNYHDLVDMPFFVGRFDFDSVRVGDRWARLASYPSGTLAGVQRTELNQQIQRMIPPQAAVFGETPFASYTTLLIFEPSYGGGSALEHQNSHVGIYTPLAIGNLLLTSITSHEIVHAWNVKRLRPAELWPYDYDEPQATPLLWVSEGITDYYADVSLARAGLVPADGFYQLTAGKINEVNDARPVALEDASLSTWVKPTDGTETLYYPKGSLAGLLFDILIRDASDNRAGLDDVMRELYRTTFKQGRGFTTEQFLAAASRAAGGRSFDDVHARYIDGRERYPWDTILPLAGMRLAGDTIKLPRVGVFSAADSSGVQITALEPGGAAEEAGVREGDYLVAIGEVQVDDQEFGAKFRQRYGNAAEGSALPLRVRRDGQVLTLPGKLHFNVQVQWRVVGDARAAGKALRIRNGILKGTVGDR
ncbi:MAG TPA: PDZ domain-containing protein [Gemmatimonadaceae bacterium]|nr:PDZ domain-containing protein [Gemmatimonadaceae bacterium]